MTIKEIMGHNYINAASVDQVLAVLAEQRAKARLIAGGTDLMLEIERGARKGIETLVDITRVPGLDQIIMDEDGIVHLGCLVTHNQCAASLLLRRVGMPLALACWEVGAPQIRNRATVAGNVITASPANDTIPALMALGAEVTLRSVRGERRIPLGSFYPAFRRTVMEPDEMLVEISFPALQSNQRGNFIKLGLRRAQAIAVVNAGMVITFDRLRGEELPTGKKITSAAIALGSVTATIGRAAEAEAFLVGRVLDDETIAHAAQLAQGAAAPIDDVRSSAGYRLEMVQVCVGRALRAILRGEMGAGLPLEPVLLWDRNQVEGENGLPEASSYQPGGPIRCWLNGKDIEVTTGQQKSLLRWLREDAGLTGTKEGCAEGECGACTVFLDGRAVMSCLVPAPRAHGAVITTVEGLMAGDGQLHPVQQAFIEEGAVQCGYCIPGFIMSAAMLLEEKGAPGPSEIRQAITGNLCRCTGYYKILAAIERAALQSREAVSR